MTIPADYVFQNESTPFAIFAKNEGSWGNDIKVVIQPSENYEEDAIFDLVVYQMQSGNRYLEVERFTTTRKVDFLNDVNKNIYIENLVNKESNFIDVLNNENVPLTEPANKEVEELLLDNGPYSESEFYFNLTSNNIVPGSVELEIALTSEIDPILVVLVDDQLGGFNISSTIGSLDPSVSVRASINYVAGIITLYVEGSELIGTYCINKEYPYLILESGTDDLNPSASSYVEAIQVIADKVNYPDVQFIVSAGITDPAFQSAIVEIAENRKDCIALLDFEDSGMSVQEQVAELKDRGINSSYAAIASPWQVITDPFLRRERKCPPSVVLASKCIAVGTEGEVWDSPAGPRRGILNGAIDLTQRFDEPQADFLFKNRINPMINKPGIGFALWGQKTLTTSTSSISRINVRRLMIFINRSIVPYLEEFLEEANTEDTRKQIESGIEGFMEDIQNRGGVTGFSVRCDEVNNTPQVIDNNELRVDLYIQPTKTIEQIKLTAILTGSGVELQ